MNQELIQEIENKYRGLGENPDNYLKGLIHAKPINYWDYVEVDTLLSLQKTRTDFKDEEIFIMYHQVTELTLKMMIHEIKQLVYGQTGEAVWIDKLGRLSRYTSMLINSFDIMRSGMSYEDYNTFRYTLTPASGFQSAQFRLIELYCTRPENLLSEEGIRRIRPDTDIRDYFDHLYWKEAGLDRSTGKKSLTLRQFEHKYLDRLISLAKKMKGNTLEEKISSMGQVSPQLKEKLKEFDHLYNVAWPLVHLQTATHYLDRQGENKAATGGSTWKKYLHPNFQRRTFFPGLWSPEELQNWGIQTTAHEDH
jgi:tryptophan 2,3-dioxygenase